MDEHNNGLWQGGPWERPDFQLPTPPPVEIPKPQPPVLRVKKRRKKHFWSRWPWFAWLFIALFIFAVLTTGVQWVKDSFIPHLPGTEQEEPQQKSTDEISYTPPAIPRVQSGSGPELELLPEADLTLDFSEIYEKMRPSMVSISSYEKNSVSGGTGIIISEDGYILTNAHVVADGLMVQVTLSDNLMYDAKLVGFAPEDDLAVIKIEAEHLTPAQFGDSNLLRVGDPVAALGDGLGFRSTFTEGIVSALDREMEMGKGTVPLIQTSAAINFGNSGGALINQYGQVVGITAVKIVRSDGSAEAINFAIPSHRVKYVSDALMAGKNPQPGSLGVTVSTHALPGGGLEVMGVEKWSSGQDIGLKKGDVLLEANGILLTRFENLSRLKQDFGAGDSIDLVWSRDGRTYTGTITLKSPGEAAKTEK